MTSIYVLILGILYSQDLDTNKAKKLKNSSARAYGISSNMTGGFDKNPAFGGGIGFVLRNRNIEGEFLIVGGAEILGRDTSIIQLYKRDNNGICRETNGRFAKDELCNEMSETKKSLYFSTPISVSYSLFNNLSLGFGIDPARSINPFGVIKLQSSRHEIVTTSADVIFSSKLLLLRFQLTFNSNT